MTRGSRLVHRIAYLLVLAGLSASFSTLAQTSTDHINDLIDQPGGAGLGFVIRTETSPYKDGGTRSDLLPLYLYEGQHFFLSADRLGIKLYNDDEQRWDLYITQRLEGFPDEERTHALEGMETRTTTGDLAMAYARQFSWGTLRGAVLHDITGISHGTEVRLGYTYDWRFTRWVLRPDFTVSWRDANLNNYYYGVKESEVTPDRPFYEPGAGVNATLGLYATYAMTQNSRLITGVSATYLDSGIRKSPIVRDGIQPAIYLGAVYDFGSYHDVALSDEGSPTYLKFFYGRSAGPGCHLVKIMALSCVSLDNENPTDIAGFQIGKPFIRRFLDWPLDFTGYLGLTYHDDRGLATSGPQVDIYMKAFFYGFPWNRWVETRLGLGYGVSYAANVPYTEISSQARRERETSRLLNYLDPSIDVNIGDIFRSNALRRTYFGFGVSHRSGIFASSRLLGNVDGGSNYIYTYIETAL
ncbi:MipA/OmpV family protein [Dyella solisilvae]|uniref:MipA/OmpV family protein n=1 Tax=Dyella solisilvae TaxID=1920168 RepID=A0A370K820_9GAMM|nr:MipA/OmpV family protein [Dyella solisilvae]RDI98783.1 MipA/OmpV family protein [Dyella solisilvae]